MNEDKLEKLDFLLKKEKADYSIFYHDSIFKTAAEGAEHLGISLSETTPTLILKSKENYFAAIICGNTRIAYKKLKQALNIKDINMADSETVSHLTGSKVGEVCLINNGFVTLIDKNVLNNKYCYGGCGTPKATLKINTHDLIRITHGQVLDFAEVRI